MKFSKIISTFILLSISSLALIEARQSKFEIGQLSKEYIDASRERPLLTEIWYPTHDEFTPTNPEYGPPAVFKPIHATANAQLAEGTFPLLLISHGTGGDRFSHTWVIDEFVRKGYIVVSVDHYGNTFSNKIAREFVKWWERPIDIQFILTKVLEDKTLSPHIDSSKIGGIGFSLGGYTNIALAGGYVDRNLPAVAEAELPPEFPQADTAIDFATDPEILASFEAYAKKVKDPRIKAFFVMAPAIGFGFQSPEQTKEISAPVYIMAGKADFIAPVEENAANFHSLIANSTLQLFDEPVGHYVFLNQATEFGKQVAPAVCVDPEGVDRAGIHEETVKQALMFFNKQL